jgi:hypothetical protein
MRVAITVEPGTSFARDCASIVATADAAHAVADDVAAVQTHRSPKKIARAVAKQRASERIKRHVTAEQSGPHGTFFFAR